MNLGKERGKKTDQELSLEFKHVGVKAGFAVSVPVDVQEQFPLPAGLKSLRVPDELEKRLSCLIKPFVTVHDVVKRHGVLAPVDPGLPDIAHDPNHNQNPVRHRHGQDARRD